MDKPTPEEQRRSNLSRRRFFNSVAAGATEAAILTMPEKAPAQGAALEAGASGFSAGRSVQLPLHGAKAVVVDLLALALLLRSVEGTTWRRVVRAGTPGFGGEDRLGFNPVPTEGGMHLGMGYGGEGAMVP